MDRIIHRYDLQSIDQELVSRRAGDEGGTTSLRDLCDFFNQQVLRRAMELSGMNPLEGEVENTYRLLTGDDVGSGMQTRMRKRLEREGIDPEELRKSFVSHPTIGSHLESCLEYRTPTDERSPTDRGRERILKMQNRSEAVTKDTLEQLVGADRINGGELSVFVDARVMCETCGRQDEIRRFIENGGCECRTDGT